MRQGPFRSLQFRFTALVLCAAAFVMGGFGVVGYHDAERKMLQAVEAQITGVSRRLQFSLSPTLWTFNATSIPGIVDSEITAESIVAITVETATEYIYGAQILNGTVVQLLNAPTNLVADEIRQFDLLEPDDVNSQRKRIGVVHLYINLKPVQQALATELLALVSQFSALCLVIAIVVVVALRWTVLRPIARLGDGLAEIASGATDLNIRMPDASVTEFEKLVASFNAFAQKLQDAMGAGIDTVQSTIQRVSSGDLSHTFNASDIAGDSIYANLSRMQRNLQAHNAAQVQSAVDLRLVAEELQLAKDAADKASQVKGDFLANMSHEIRTPMNAIIGLSGLALKNEMPAKLRDYLEKIRQSGDHLLGIINDILDFSKIESGKMEIETVPFDLQMVIENVVTVLTDKVDAKGLELLCHIAPDIPETLIGDPLRIGQICINYANNALKFTSRGEIQFRVRIQEKRGDTLLLRFEVSDTGIGLKPDQLSRLFQSFAQADSSTTRQYGGTGLGLSISKNLAQAMGGEVGVNSEFGKGSTFWFTVQLSAGSSEPYIPMPSIDLRGKRVLVVDDNEAAALVLCETLGELGFSVQSVDSGQAALECLTQAASAQQPFAFFLVDWLMPAMDGLDTVRQLQAMHLPHAPAVILVTAHRREELMQNAARLGVQHVLSKPVNGSLLVNTMMQLMGLASRTSAPVRRSKASTMESELGAIQGARILLVEDNEINQQVATEVLTGAGFDVDVAENGQVAVHRVEARFASARPYDLVLMDMQMPVMDGVTATRLIRETHPSEILPIVAMTANAMTTDKERCLEAGMNGFVRKPIEADELWRELLRCIRIRPGLGVAPPRQKTTRPTARLDALANIDGLDSESGLLRTGGNPDFYVSMVRKFMQSQANAVGDAEAALALGNVALAERLAHTLHGVAGNLGATTLQTQARALEQALRQGTSDDIDTLFAKTQDTLALLIDRLAQAIATLPTDSSPEAQENFDPLQLEQVLNQLKVMLQDDDPNGATFWTQHAVALRKHLRQAPALEDAIQGFDFERAVRLLNEEALH